MSLRLTRTGTALALGAPPAVVAGALLGSVDLLALGLAGLGAPVVAGLVAAGPCRVDARTAVDRGRVRIGDPVVAGVEVRATALAWWWRPEVEVAVGEGAVVLGPLRRGDDLTRRVALDTARRGRVVVGPVRVGRRGRLVERLVEAGGDPATVVVLPRAPRLPAATGGSVPDAGSLAPYVPGDEPRAVHWRASARHRRLLVRRRETTESLGLTVVLDTRASGGPVERFEEAVAAVVGLLGVAPTARLATAHDPAVAAGRSGLDALATLTPAPGGDLGEVLAIVRRRSTPDERLVLVTGAGDAAATIAVARVAAGTDPPPVVVHLLPPDGALGPAVRRPGRRVVVGPHDRLERVWACAPPW